MQQSALNFIYFLAAIGAIYFIIFLVKLLWTLIRALIPTKNLRESYGANAWAVVTGGSDGIGLGFCQELAKAGINVCLIARNPKKCVEVQTKLRQLNQTITTRSVIADFTECQKQGFFQKIMQKISDIDVGILVNNVGISNMGYLHEIPTQRLLNQINVNVVPMTILSSLIVKRMIQRPERSAIINLSSIAGVNPIPYIATYSGTKAFNDFFSKAIALQYEDKIDVLSVQPLYVQSNLSKQTKSCSVASRTQCAEGSLKALGIVYDTKGWWMHRFQAACMSCIPGFILRYSIKSQSKKIMDRERQQSVPAPS